MRIVEVAPQDVGWVMFGCGEALFFRSGRAAERAARRVALALSGSQVIELRIFDRRGHLAGQLRYAGGAGVLEPFVGAGLAARAGRGQPVRAKVEYQPNYVA